MTGESLTSTTASNFSLERALILRMSNYVGEDVNPEDVDCVRSFFDSGGFFLGDYALDSLTLAELMLVIEEDFAIEIVGKDGLSKFESISALADILRERATPAAVADFERKWCNSPPGS